MTDLLSILKQAPLTAEEAHAAVKEWGALSRDPEWEDIGSFPVYLQRLQIKKAARVLMEGMLPLVVAAENHHLCTGTPEADRCPECNELKACAMAFRELEAELA